MEPHLVRERQSRAPKCPQQGTPKVMSRSWKGVPGGHTKVTEAVAAKGHLRGHRQVAKGIAGRRSGHKKGRKRGGAGDKGHQQVTKGPSGSQSVTAGIGVGQKEKDTNRRHKGCPQESQNRSPKEAPEIVTRTTAPQESQIGFERHN